MIHSALLLAGIIAIAPAQSPPRRDGSVQSAAPPSAGSTTPLDPEALGISIDRIREALDRPPAPGSADDRLIFRVQVFGKSPTIEDILGRDFLDDLGRRVPRGAVTHQEFLNSVTPEGFRGVGGVEIGAAIGEMIERYKRWRTGRHTAAARKEVREALDALLKARREAGLADK